MHERYKRRVYRQGSGQERVSDERLKVFNADESLSMAEAVVTALYGLQCSAVRLLGNGRQGSDFFRRRPAFLSPSLPLHGGAA
jgi:hypothetical protein